MSWSGTKLQDIPKIRILGVPRREAARCSQKNVRRGENRNPRLKLTLIRYLFLAIIGDYPTPSLEHPRARVEQTSFTTSRILL